MRGGPFRRPRPLPRRKTREHPRDVWDEGEENLHSGTCWLSGMERHETLRVRVHSPRLHVRTTASCTQDDSGTDPANLLVGFARSFIACRRSQRSRDFTKNNENKRIHTKN